MSIRRPSKKQPEIFEFNPASLEAEVNSKYFGCSFEGCLKLIYQLLQKLYLATPKQLEHQPTYGL